MPVSIKLLRGVGDNSSALVDDSAAVQSLQQRLQNLNCIASVDQVRGYLVGSGRTAREINALADTDLADWFRKCFDSVYDPVATRPSATIIN